MGRPVVGEVDLAPFREAFARSELSKTEIARRLGVDESRVRRMLNPNAALSHHTTVSGEKRRYYYTRISYDLAVRLAEAMNLEPWEVGV